LRRAMNFFKYPRYHSNCGFIRHSWNPTIPMHLRSNHGEVLLSLSLSSPRLGSYNANLPPTACTDRRFSEGVSSAPSSSKSFLYIGYFITGSQICQQFLEFISLNFAAYCLGQFVFKHNHSRILVRSGMGFNIILDFLL